MMTNNEGDHDDADDDNHDVAGDGDDDDDTWFMMISTYLHPPECNSWFDLDPPTPGASLRFLWTNQSWTPPPLPLFEKH